MSRTHFPCAYFDIPTNSTLILCTHTNHPHWISLHTNTHSHQLQTSPPWWLANKPDITYMGRVIGQMGGVCVCARTLLLVKAFSSVMVRRGRGWGDWGGGRESMSHLCCSPFPAAPWLLLFFFFSSSVSLVWWVKEAKREGGGKKKRGCTWWEYVCI